MYYTIYKTTNTINGKFYIGKHQTKDLNDGYIGSGKLLKRAINKYGLDNFHTEILHVCESEKQMNILEKILVVPDPELNYNLCSGGHGGFGYINRTGLNRGDSETRSRSGKLGATSRINRLKTDPEYKRITSEKCRTRMLRNPLRNGFLGKNHTDETKQKMKKSKNVGLSNSQYGTCWITNGVENKKIKKEYLNSWTELGYYKGRK
jgi:group I intron endonuclease